MASFARSWSRAARAKGTWKFTARGIDIELLEPIGASALSKLEEDARDTYRFVGTDAPSELINVRYAN